jgi:hypothetical protein
MSFWLIVETHDNWLVDRKSGFRTFGLPESKRPLALQLAMGDILLVYISSKRSAFAGARRIEKAGVDKLGLKGEYDRSFPICLATSPIISLDEPQWVSVRSLKGHLSFLQGPHWSQFFRTSLRRLRDEDGARVLAALRRADSQLAAEAHPTVNPST